MEAATHRRRHVTRIGLVVEDRYDGEACRHLALQVCPDAHIFYVPAGGSGEIKRRGHVLIEKLLRRRADCVIVVLDRDQRASNDQLIVAVQRHCRPHADATLVLAIEELEAWLLADVAAVSAFLGARRVVEQPGDTQLFPDPTRELKDVFRRLTEGRRTYEKADAAGIAAHIEDVTEARGRNASLGDFCDAVEACC